MLRSLVMLPLCLAVVAACATPGPNVHNHAGLAEGHPDHVAAGVMVAEPPVTPPAADEAPPPPPSDKFTARLPTGVEIVGNLTGVEAQLVAFIQDDSKVVDKDTWFSFDRLLFQTGSADLDMAFSQNQLSNIAEILKAYPKVELKIGGYTDNTGSAATNQKLSQKRAENVAAAIVGMGIDKARLSPEGYGPNHPVCAANDTEECRAQNRRIDVRVKAK